MPAVALALPPAPPPFAVGERLSCASARTGRELDVVVGRIDAVGPGVTVVSVSVHDRAPGAVLPAAAHAPYSETALAASCRTPVGVRVAPDPEFAAGYAIWRKAFEAGSGGYFTIGVDASLDVMAATLRQATTQAAPTTPAPVSERAR